MTSLKEMSLTHKTRKELSDLPKVSVDLDVKEDEFKNSLGQMVKYNFVEIDGYKYTIRNKELRALQTIMNVRPSTKAVKFQKTEQGDIMVIPLD